MKYLIGAFVVTEVEGVTGEDAIARFVATHRTSPLTLCEVTSGHVEPVRPCREPSCSRFRIGEGACLCQRVSNDNH